MKIFPPLLILFLCLSLMFYITGCGRGVSGRSDGTNGISVTKYSEATGKYYEETANGYKAAIYEKDEITIEKIANWLTSCQPGEKYYRFVYSDPDSWDMYIYYSPEGGLQYSGFHFSVEGAVVTFHVTDDDSPNRMESDYLLIRVQAPLRGAWPGSSGLYISGEKIEMQNSDL